MNRQKQQKRKQRPQYREAGTAPKKKLDRLQQGKELASRGPVVKEEPKKEFCSA